MYLSPNMLATTISCWVQRKTNLVLLTSIVEILQLRNGDKEIIEVKNYKPNSRLEKLLVRQHSVRRWDIEHLLHKLFKDNKSEDEIYVSSYGFVCY